MNNKNNQTGFNFNMTDDEAVEYLKNKGEKISFNYDEMKMQAHHKAFTVAKVMRNDLLHDIHQSIINAKENGVTFEAWKKELKPALAKYGWLGKTEVTNHKTGETKVINVGSRRLKNIYRTNMNVAVAVSRYKEMKSLPKSVYWEYVAIDDARSRHSHKLLNGTVRHRDDAFWGVNYPPNGWGCRCKVRALSLAEVEARGLK